MMVTNTQIQQTPPFELQPPLWPSTLIRHCDYTIILR